MNKFIKIAGVWVVAEVAYALGKGHTLALVRKCDPKLGDDIRNVVEAGVHDKDNPILYRAISTIICKTDDFWTKYYNDRDQKDRG